ncbi:fumarylacetoacetate hydrolase family protein [Subtercola sp. YIM 133946]|uniref:fumarylacetoacetate hydrolase family protein n=1 Tax=Subtercola sp. YIM 133946 TaxID=3118909 RepID=UPI002F955FA2
MTSPMTAAANASVAPEPTSLPVRATPGPTRATPDPTQATPGPTQSTPDRFFVRRVYCVGRNYAEHAREMGGDPNREPPFFFTKPADAVYAVAEGVSAEGIAPGTVPYPPQTANLSHEIELVVAIGTGGRDIDPVDALDHVVAYGVGVDLTRRDLQDAAKQQRRPWDLSKGFDYSGPVSELVPAGVAGHPDAAPIWFDVDGVRRQTGDLADQIWSVAEIVAALSSFVELRPGDLVFTGTPAGVGALVVGDSAAGGIGGLAEIAFTVV